MSANSSVSYYSFNSGELKSQGKKEIEKILSNIPGDKILLMEKRLAKSLNKILDGIQIFENNNTKVAELNDETPDFSHHIVFLISPLLSLVKLVARHIKNMEDTPNKGVSVYFLPCITDICNQILIDEKCKCTVGNCNISLFPLDGDIFSLELDNFYPDTYSKGDISMLSVVVNSINLLQSLYGDVCNIKAKGPLSSLIFEQLQIQRKLATYEPSAKPPEIDTLILIDRSVDMITPLVSGLTYESLIDELIGINNSAILLDEELIREVDMQKKTNTLDLDKNDSIYQLIRNNHINTIGVLLNQKSKEIKQMFDSRPDKSKEVKEIRDFVKKIPELQDSFMKLQIHINLAEKVTKYSSLPDFRQKWLFQRTVLEGTIDLKNIFVKIAKCVPIEEVLCDLCLCSLVNNGIKDFNLVRQSIIHSYGFPVLFNLIDLEKLGLLINKDNNTSSWSNIRKSFNLIQDKVDIEVMKDLHYATSGYAPITSCLVQYALQGFWKTKEDHLKLLQGKSKVEDNINKKQSNTDKKVVCVYFIGGVTYLEINTIRQIKRKYPEYEFVIMSTNITNGKKLMKSLCEQVHLKQTEI